MLCRDPYVKAGQAFPCGKCLPCLVRRKKLWTHRLMLESLCHTDNAFVTLTYAEESLPSDMSLDPVSLELFMKRLRKEVSPRLLRFYGVGEYGEKSERPHYHVLLFNFPTCLHGRSMYSKRRDTCCSQCDLIRRAWGYGNVVLGSVTTESVGYTCSYVVKNMRRTDDTRLKGRWPEFARMSLRPGIGYNAMWELADVIMQYGLDESECDVPTSLRHGKSMKPLGRYLRAKLRGMIGHDEKSPDYQDQEMLDMYKAAVAAAPNGGEVRRTVFKNMLIEAGNQRVINMQSRLRIHKQEHEL